MSSPNEMSPILESNSSQPAVSESSHLIVTHEQPDLVRPGLIINIWHQEHRAFVKHFHMTVARQILNLGPYFAAFPCLFQNGPFVGFFRSSSPGCLWVRIPCWFFNRLIPLPQSITIHRHFLILICSSIWLLSSCFPQLRITY